MAPVSTGFKIFLFILLHSVDFKKMDNMSQSGEST